MTANVGSTDRIVRLVAAAVALLVAFFGVGATSTLGIVLIILGVLLAVTAVVRFCPIYRALGMSTNRADAR